MKNTNQDEELGSDYNPIDIVTDKVIDWITDMQQKNIPLPKTREKLQNSIQKVCFWKEYLDPQTVLQQLTEINAIRLDSEGKVEYSENFPIPRVNVPGTDFRENAQIEAVMKRLSHWLKNGAKPKLYSSLESSISQLCVYKKQISTDGVVERLILKGIVSENEDVDRTLVYH
eukprot:TRINITY_DN3626_c0_g1_i1.p1 TRINITY_DN3626_c0_g1~~TRINITY_DN3626_c0_g1_i1.p1  ORF type:complete len:172 (-),score=51.85 TRINITY_DN3626_c0_g1_i1:20-535(-)